MASSPKVRIDQLLVQKGIVPTRQRARALLLAGRVMVAEQKVDKPGLSFVEDVAIRILGQVDGKDQRYVSRGGLKLEAALKHWNIAVEGRACVDVGTSTGGFTDCLLQHGARQVSCVDTGFGQIAMSLRAMAESADSGQAPRVKLYERTNARTLAPGSLDPGSLDPGSLDPGSLDPGSLDPGSLDPGSLDPGFLDSVPVGDSGSTLDSAFTVPPITLLVMDVSFISATLLLPAVLAAAPALTEAVVLVKPQFEAGREHVGKGGIVRDEAAHLLAIERVRSCLASLGATELEVIDSPITGMEGNREFLLHAMLAGKAAAAQ